MSVQYLALILMGVIAVSSTGSSGKVSLSRRIVGAAISLPLVVGTIPLSNEGFRCSRFMSGLVSKSAVAADVNPEAIGVRRVMEEPAMAPAAPRKKAVKLASGVEYFDAVEGTGKTAEEGKTVQFQWVLRRSNGYFVDSSDNYGGEGGEPFIYKVGNTQKIIPGLDEGIRGMKVGGVRKLNTPANVAFVAGGVGDGKPGPMPAGFGPRRQILTRISTETWYWEIKLLKVK